MTGGQQYLTTDGHNQAGFFCQRQETRGRQHSQGRMLPAHQRFQPDVMIFLVVLIIVIVQIIQFIGNRLASRLDKR